MLCNFCVESRCTHLYGTVLQYVVFQGDTKGSAKGGETSSKKDVQPSPNAQVKCNHVPGSQE